MCKGCGCQKEVDTSEFGKRLTTDIIDQKITDAGFKFEKLDPNVWLIHDFMKEAERKEIISLGDSWTEEWGGFYIKHIEDRAERKYGTRNLEETGTEVTNNWDDKVAHLNGRTALGDTLMQRLVPFFFDGCNYDFRTFGILQRMYNGVELKAHYDQYVDMRMAWAAVIYVNDDYNGGEFFFTYKGIKLKPPAGSLLVFPTWEEYHHGVTHVTEGPTRYVLPAFIWSEPEVYERELAEKEVE